MTEEGFLDEEEGFMDWECDDCLTCEGIAYHTVRRNEDEIPEKWICVGKIIRPKKPKNIHEAMNQVRFCIADFETEDKSKLWNWTPYEALSVATVLTYGVRAVLEEQHVRKHKRLKKRYLEE